MSTTKPTKKSGRTPEEQADRDDRKSAKKATAEDAQIDAEPVAESSAMAVAKDEDTPQRVKRRRSTEPEDDEDLLEIDVEAPEPLSKAEARAARKRAKKGLPEAPRKAKNADAQNGDGEDEDGKGTEVTRRAYEKKQNSIWIGNLAYKTTAETLRAFLMKGITELGGETEGSVTRINLPTKPGKGQFAPTNKGFAYADFATPELQALGLQLSESFFEGRKLLIKLGNDHKETPNARTPKPDKVEGAAILKKQKNPPSSTLFVGNLSFDMTEVALRNFIESNAAGRPDVEVPVKAEPKKEDEEEVEDLDKDRGGKKSGLRKVRLGAFEDSGRCKGFAFLDFHSIELATATLINRKNYLLDERPVLLQFASEDAAKRAGSGPKRNHRIPRTERTLGMDKPIIRPPKRKFEPVAAVDVQPEVVAPGMELPDSAPATEYAAPRPKKNDQRGKKWEAAGRPRPGAALAMAKREKVGIVEAQGNKITFD